MLTWKNPSDETVVHPLTPHSRHPLMNFYLFTSPYVDYPMVLHVNALKWDGAYQTTAVMRDIVEALFKKQEKEKS
jgi:hypothetical protein